MYYTITSANASEVRLDRSGGSFNAAKAFALVFDNVKGVLRVTGSKDETEIGYVPYGDIEYFSIARRTRGKGQIYYDVIMHVKNLGSWFLFEYRKLEDAEAELKRLTTSIHLENKGTSIGRPAFPQAVGNMTHDGSKTVVRWNNIVKTSDIVKLVMGGFAGFVFISLIFISVMQDPGLIGGIVFIVFMGFYVAIIYALTKQTLSDKTRTYGFSFGPNEIEYFEERISNGAKVRSQVIPASDWFGLAYPAGVSTTGEDIIIVSNARAKDYRDMLKADDSYLQMQRAFRKLDHYPRIRFKDRSPVERLSFVNWANDQTSNKRL